MWFYGFQVTYLILSYIIDIAFNILLTELIQVGLWES